MNAVTLLWMLGGVMAVLVTMLAALIVARTLDDSRSETRDPFATKLAELTSRTTQHGGTTSGMGWLSGGVSATLVALAAASAADKKKADAQPETASRKQLKAVLAGLAIGGAILMAIVGSVVGDGN